MSKREDEAVGQILELYQRDGMSRKLIEDIQREIVDRRVTEGVDAILRVLMKARDLHALDDLIDAGLPLTPEHCDQVAACVADVPINRMAANKGCYPLIRKLLGRSSLLRRHLFYLLRSAPLASTSDAMVTNARDNILIALRSLPLTAGEIAIVKKLRDQLPPAYRDNCEELLLNQMGAGERDEALAALVWRKAFGRNEGDPFERMASADPGPTPSVLPEGVATALGQFIAQEEEMRELAMPGCAMVVVPADYIDAAVSLMAEHGYHVCDAIKDPPDNQPDTDRVADWCGFDDYSKILILMSGRPPRWLLSLVHWAGEDEVFNCEPGYSSQKDYRAFGDRSVVLMMTELDYPLFQVTASPAFFRDLRGPRPLVLGSGTLRSGSDARVCRPPRKGESHEPNLGPCP